MKPRTLNETGYGSKLAVAAMTLCTLASLYGCVDLGDLDFGEIVDALGGGDCPVANDGKCDDGRPGSATSICPFGTDSADCDGLGGDTGASPSVTNVTGRWRVTEVDSSNCDDTGRTRSFTWDVIQSGSTLTVLSIERGESLTGTITGNNINLRGIFFEDGGITNVSSTNINVSSSGNTISGIEIWTWSDGFDFCSGTTSVSGSRI